MTHLLGQREENLSIERTAPILSGLVADARQILNKIPASMTNDQTNVNTSDVILASGNGKGNSATKFFWGFFILIATGFMYLPIPAMIEADRARVELPKVIPHYSGRADYINKVVDEKDAHVVKRLCYAAIGIVVSLVYATLYHISIVGSYIRVQENGIAGKGAGKGFFWGNPLLFDFRLNYNRITSVNATKTAIIVYASGVQYKCYATNPGEIQRVIVEQQLKRAS